METVGAMRAYLRQIPKGENEHENNETETEVPSKAALSNLYPYDRVFNEYCDQDYIFRCALKRTILYALDGYNITIIAYGHSGTGKTHTIFGGSDIANPKDAGMMPKSVAHLLEVIEQEKLEHTVTVSYLDIYNEKIYDLLSAIDDDTELIIKEDMDDANSVIIENLTEVTINNMPDLYRIKEIAAEKRLNYSSFENYLLSQRHSLFYVTIYTREESVDGETILKRANLIFVDAAASDYSVQSDQTDVQSPEDVNTIHQSLNTFNECMMKLACGSTDIPYGKSKLTRLLRDSLGGYTKTILLGTVNCSSLEVTGDLVYLAKKIKTKPWIRHVFDIQNVIQNYKVEIEKLNSEIKHICTTSLFPITNDTNFILEEFEGKQTMIINKVQSVKFLNKSKNRWLAVYRVFKNTEDDTTDIDEITEQHFLNIHADKINYLQLILQKQEHVFRKNMDQTLKLIYNQLAQLLEKSLLTYRILNFKKTSISKHNECFDKFVDFADFFTNSTKIINESMKNNDAVVKLLCKLTNISRIMQAIHQFQATSREVVPSTIKYLTDQKEYVTAVVNNISSCISEITSSGRQYIETKSELYAQGRNTLTESMELQKTQQMDFEEKYKNAIEALKEMKSASDTYFHTCNVRSKICESNLTARRASLTEARNMINAWQRQTVMKVVAFAGNIANNHETQKGKLADSKKLSADTVSLLMSNIKVYQNIIEVIDIHMIEVLYRMEKNTYRQEENIRLLIALYFKDVKMIFQETVLSALHRNELEQKETKELEHFLNEYILKSVNLCTENKNQITYITKELDSALEQYNLRKFNSNYIIINEISPDIKGNERFEEESSGNTSVTLQPEPISCNRPKYEGTLRERCKMRKTKSRRRREYEAEKARRESCNVQEEYVSPLRLE